MYPVPASQETEAGPLLESKSLRLTWGTVTPCQKTQKNQKSKSWFFKNTNRIDKSWIILFRGK
jgi:hypothetical protein